MITIFFLNGDDYYLRSLCGMLFDIYIYICDYCVVCCKDNDFVVMTITKSRKK